MAEKKRIVPFLFGEDEPTLAGIATYKQLMTMNFATMRERQDEFEENLKGTDMSLSDLNEPLYLLKRGVIGESKEALEALRDTNRGVDSMAFKSEMVDILVFLGNLLNYADVSEKVLHQMLEEKLKKDSSDSLEDLLSDTIPRIAAQAIDVYSVSNQEVTPAFINQVAGLAEMIIRALQKTTISPEELNFHFAQVLVKNFIKYRPEVVINYTMEVGMDVARANFSKSNSEPVTDANVAEKQKRWAEADIRFNERQKQTNEMQKTLVRVLVASE